MSKLKTFSLSLSTIALLAAAPALADVDAREIWDEWQAQGAAIGQTLSATSVTDTDTGLRISGMTVLADQGGSTSTVEIDEITLNENTDGTLSVEMSDPVRITTVSQIDDGPAVRIDMGVRHQGLNITVSGDAGARDYEYDADSITISSEQMTVDGQSAGEMNIAATITDFAGQHMLTGDTVETTEITSNSSFSGMSGTIDAAAPNGQDGGFKLSFNMGPMTSTGSGSMFALAFISQMSDDTSVPENFSLLSDLEYERLSYEVTVDEAGSSFNMSFANEGGEMGVALTEGGLTYDLSAVNVDAAILTNEFPAPIEISADSTGFLFTLPLMPEDEPSDMALRLDYRGLEVNEALWSMVDPGQAIPRDPATLIVDITGKVQMLVNLLAGDPTAFQGPPGELREVTLNDLQINAAGASLEGEGDLEFAPGQMVPMPVGTIDLRAAGLNALLDRLTSAGLLPEPQAAMVRGMSGMFARPGPTADTLETTIEFQPGGGITANGIPLQ